MGKLTREDSETSISGKRKTKRKRSPVKDGSPLFDLSPDDSSPKKNKKKYNTVDKVKKSRKHSKDGHGDISEVNEKDIVEENPRKEKRKRRSVDKSCATDDSNPDVITETKIDNDQITDLEKYSSPKKKNRKQDNNDVLLKELSDAFAVDDQEKDLRSKKKKRKKDTNNILSKESSDSVELDDEAVSKRNARKKSKKKLQKERERHEDEDVDGAQNNSLTIVNSPKKIGNNEIPNSEKDSGSKKKKRRKSDNDSLVEEFCDLSRVKNEVICEENARDEAPTKRKKGHKKKRKNRGIDKLSEAHNNSNTDVNNQGEIDLILITDSEDHSSTTKTDTKKDACRDSPKNSEAGDKEICDDTAKDRVAKKSGKVNEETPDNRDIDKSNESPDNPTKADVNNESKIDNNQIIFCEDNSMSSSDDGIFVPRRRTHKVPTEVVKAAKIVESTINDEDTLSTSQKCPKLSDADAMKLTTMKVELIHEVPPQHKIEIHAGTQSLSEIQRQEFTKYIEIKQGFFSADEDDLIIHNWKKFCKKHNWKKSIFYPFMHIKNKGFFFLTGIENRIKFVQFLANGLPNRTLYSVYHRFRKLYSTHKQCRYSPEEDDVILNVIGNNDQSTKTNKTDKKFASVAKQLNRTRQSVWRRWVLLMKKREIAEGSD